MATKITDTEMSSDLTRHAARAAESGGWTVSWLPGRTLTRDQAITAMTIAEMIGAHATVGDPLHAGHRLWPHVDQWAAELAMTGPDAVAEASLSPEDHAGMPRVRTLAMDGQPPRTGYLVALDKSTGTARVRIGGETVTMPACDLQYDSGEPEPSPEASGDGSPGGRDASRRPRGNASLPTSADAPARYSALIGAMTDDERSWVLAYIAGAAPEVFDAALASRAEVQAAALEQRQASR